MVKLSKFSASRIYSFIKDNYKNNNFARLNDGEQGAMFKLNIEVFVSDCAQKDLKKALCVYICPVVSFSRACTFGEEG